MFAAISFYVVVGVTACVFFFLKGSSLSGDLIMAHTTLAESVPETSGDGPVAIPETEQETETPQTQPAETQAPETESPQEAPVYYAFTTLNTTTSLHVREGASMEAKIIARLSPGVTGYVLEKGPVWSLVDAGGIVGYIFNEYLEFREIPREEYPDYPTP